eukprot:g825.t1
MSDSEEKTPPPEDGEEAATKAPQDQHDEDGDEDEGSDAGGSDGKGQDDDADEEGEDYVVKMTVEKVDEPGRPKLTRQGSVYIAGRRFKFLCRCGRKTATAVLLFSNILFAFLAIGIISAGAFVLSSNYGKFFDLTHIALAICFGVILLCISIFGCMTALSLNRKYLVMYALLATTVCGLQIVSAIYVKSLLSTIEDTQGDFDSGADTSQVALVNSMRGTIGDAFDKGKCSTCAEDNTCQHDVIYITCNNTDADWFKDFVHSHCDTTISTPAWKTCNATYTRNYDPVFCSCRASLLAEMKDRATPIFATTVSLCVLEFILAVCTLRLLSSKSASDMRSESEWRAAQRAKRRADKAKIKADARYVAAELRYKHFKAQKVEQNFDGGDDHQQDISVPSVKVQV